jgi:hypothetical protein
LWSHPSHDESVSSQVISLETGETLGPNQRGELCFKTPFLMTGYKGMPEVGVLLGYYENRLVHKNIAHEDFYEI